MPTLLESLLEIGGKVSVAMTRRPLPRQGDVNDKIIGLSWRSGDTEKNENGVDDTDWRRGAFIYSISISGPHGEFDLKLYAGAGHGKISSKMIKGATSTYTAKQIDSPDLSRDDVLRRVLSMSLTSGDGLLEFMKRTGRQRKNRASLSDYSMASDLYSHIVRVLGDDVKRIDLSTPDHTTSEPF